MKTLPATTQRAVKPCLSPVAVWQMLLTRLLEQHYGLTINDTPFCNEAVIKEHIDAGITPPMPLIFWWRNTSWCVSTEWDLAGRSNLLIFGLSIFCERGRQLVCYSKAVKIWYGE